MLIMNDNGNMDYVREKDDTDELCNEQYFGKNLPR